MTAAGTIPDECDQFVGHKSHPYALKMNWEYFLPLARSRVWPLRDVGPLTDEYSMTSDWDNQWLTGGLEPDVISGAHLDAASTFAGLQRFAADREKRIGRQQDLMAKL